MVGQLFQESNSFNRLATGAEDFAVLRGADVLTCAGQGTTLGGILDVLMRDDDIETVPVLAACARPGGPVDHATYLAFADALVAVARDGARTVDAVVLDLHGAMVTQREEDCEGALLARLRTALPDAVIAVGLDLHAHLTDAMFDAADIVVACKTNPHLDCRDAGAKAARLALATLRGEIVPVATRVRWPAILFGNDETTSGPLREVQAMAREAETGPVLDVSVFTVQAPLDVANMAQVVTVVADGTGAEALATDLAGAVRTRRDAFAIGHPSLAEALDAMEASVAQPSMRPPTRPAARPFALSDFGDRVLAGAAGDGTQVLRALLARDLRAAVPVTDPAAVAACIEAGERNHVSLAVGGTYADEPPVAIEGRVARLHPGRFVLDGPWLAGIEVCHGRTAVVEVEGGPEGGTVFVILTERSAMSQDAAFLRGLGIDVADLDVAVVKSGFHFKPSFAGIATPVVAATTGPAMYDRRRAGLKRAPLWPETEEVPPLSHPRVRRKRAGVRRKPARVRRSQAGATPSVGA